MLSSTPIKIFLAIAVFVVLPFSGCQVVKATESTFVVTVDSKESISSGDTHKYLMFTQAETFEITNSYAYFRFDGSDIYGKLTPNKEYRITVCGWRVPFLSWYRNIIKVEDTK